MNRCVSRPGSSRSSRLPAHFGLQQATNQRLHAAAAPLRSALHCLQRQKAVQEGLTRTLGCDREQVCGISLSPLPFALHPVYAHMNGPIVNCR